MSQSRVCIVAPEFIGPFPNGGVGTACYWEAFTLGAAGLDVTVLYTGPTQRESPEYWQAHFAGAAPFRYVDLSLWAAGSGDLSHLERLELPCPEARTSELVLAYLRTIETDLVMFQEFLGHGARALQARRAGDALDGVRTVTTLHSCRQWIYQGMHRLPSSPADLAVDFLERESARLADAIVSPSAHMSDWASHHWRLGGASVVPYCYDATLAQPRTVVEHAGPFDHLVFFGRLETRKGLHVFCDALVAEPALRARVARVTFLGKPSSVDGLSSEEFIAAAMSRVPGIEWRVESGLGSFEALAWLASHERVLVVTPSLVDNLPYTMIELHSRRIPFVATDIGGVPEIVGGRNRHLLASPTAEDLGRLLARVTTAGRLTVDYSTGYHVTEANAAHVRFVTDRLAEPAPVHRVWAPAQPFAVVVAGASEEDLPRVRQRFVDADPGAGPGCWQRIEEWRRGRQETPAIFIDAFVVPEAGLVERLLDVLEQPGVGAATSYYVRGNPSGDVVAAPLGAALEIGWSSNCFGGPCFAARPSAFPFIADAAPHRSFALWPAYAAMACGGVSLAIVPAPLYRAGAEAAEGDTHADLEAVIGHYHAAATGSLDLGWILKSAIGAATPQAGASRAGMLGRALYERLVSMPDDLVAAHAGLDAGVGSDPYVAHLERLRERLYALLVRWREEDPQVFVYGAGQHAKLVLSLCPELGRFIAGFIDRRPMAHFLRRPCITPDQFRDDMADAILYSSREYEGEMYARMRQARVEHALLYRDAPAEPPATTSSRLARRFGHTAADLSALRAMYSPPAWAAGYISDGDADFLAEMVAAHAPSTVVELGVASGASSAVVLHSLDRLPDRGDRRTLYSCDITPRCYFNRAYVTGDAARALYPNPRARWVLDTGMDGRRLATQLPAGSVDLTFIDANHSHPWPLIDVLHVSAVAKPHSWIVLHDVELPIQHPEYQVFGPRWLFQAWPFAKVKGLGRWTSIGAVQLPARRSELAPLALALLDRPWEGAVGPDRVGLPPGLESVEEALRRQLTATAAPVDPALAPAAGGR